MNKILQKRGNSKIKPSPSRGDINGRPADERESFLGGEGFIGGGHGSDRLDHRRRAKRGLESCSLAGDSSQVKDRNKQYTPSEPKGV